MKSNIMLIILIKFLEIEGEEGQFEYLIEHGKKVVAFQKMIKMKKI